MAIPFFAMKIDSSFLYFKKTTSRITINTKLTNTNCTKLRIMGRYLRCLTFPLSSLFSAICKRDNRKLKQANVTITIPNSFGIPWGFGIVSVPFWLSSRTISSISTASNRSIVTWKVSLKESCWYSSFPLKSEAVFGKNRNRTGVRHKITLKVLGPREHLLVEVVAS